MLLLSDNGILNFNGDLYPNIPFRNVPVLAGDVYKDTAAVIVDKHVVWEFNSGKWQQLVSTDTKLNCICYTTDYVLLVGTEAARLAWISNNSLEYIDSFDKVPERNHWMSPSGGPPDVRSLAVSIDGTIYADIHVGWMVRSKDGGKSWKNLTKGLDMDVHHVSVHPTNPSIVFAATADGFHLSKDHGDTFTRQKNNMPYRYQRACARFYDKDVYLVSTSRGPFGSIDAQLYRSEDEGNTWNLVEGLPDNISKNINTFQIIIAEKGKAYVIVEDTSIYETNDYGLHWKLVDENYPRLYGMLVMPEK